MAAYRSIAEKGETATAETLALWETEHLRHWGIHVGELAALQGAAGLTVAEVDARVLRMQNAKCQYDEKEGELEESCICEEDRIQEAPVLQQAVV